MKKKNYTEEFKSQIIKEVNNVKDIGVVARKHWIARSTVHGWIKKQGSSSTLIEGKEITKELKDKVEICEKYISQGYCAVLVLKIVKLGKSTYYYNIANRNKVKKKSVGKPAPGYSFNLSGDKICDEQIKEWIVESINGDAEFYGYRKIKEHLKREYMLVLNHKKALVLCQYFGHKKSNFFMLHF